MKLDKTFFTKLFKKYPEVLMFLSPTVNATTDYHIESLSDWLKTLYEALQDNLGELKKTMPKQITTLLSTVVNCKRSIKLERTMLSLMAYTATKENNYNFFKTIAVLYGENINDKQFKYLVTLLSKEKKPELLALGLVISDLGKVRKLREIVFQSEKIDKQDPDQFMEALLLKGKLVCEKYLPSIAELSKQEFNELQKTHLNFHWGHFVQAESTAPALEELKSTIIKHREKYLYLSFLEQCFDVIGAAAQTGGKILFNKELASVYIDDALASSLLLKNKSTQEAYETYLTKRLERCGLSGKKVSHNSHEYASAPSFL